MLTLFLVILVASYYQLKIDERRLVVAPIAAISGKCDGTSAKNGGFYAKPFELFQMRPLGSTNPTTDGPDMDVNGNRQRSGDSTDMADGVNGVVGDPNTSTAMGSMAGKSEMTDYQVETGSCAGATGTYEAEQPIGKCGSQHISSPNPFISFSPAPANTLMLCLANQCQGHLKY